MMRTPPWISLACAMLATPVLALDSINSDHARVAANLASSRLAARNAAIICDISQESSLEMAACFRHVFTQAGGTIAAEMRCRAGDRDFAGLINRMKKAKPDVIYAPIGSVECALFARQARESGLDTSMIAGSAAHAPELIDFGGKSVEGLICTTYFHEAMIRAEVGKKSQALCMNETGKQFQASPIVGADAYSRLPQAIVRAGSPDPAKIRDALWSTCGFVCITGKIMTRHDGIAQRPVIACVVRNGKFVRITD